MSAGDPRPPEGFRALAATPERVQGYNPILFHARRIDGTLALGFRVGPEHLNPGGRCHGGVLASFCDMQLAFAVLYDAPDLKTTILPTINLTLDYLAAVLPGAWVQGIGGTVSMTRNFAVAQCIVTGAWLRAQVDG